VHPDIYEDAPGGQSPATTATPAKPRPMTKPAVLPVPPPQVGPVSSATVRNLVAPTISATRM
jgi:hypothetical protein